MFCAASAMFDPASSCAAAPRATAAGATSTSRSRASAVASGSIAARSARMSWRASIGVRFIFQFPASIFLRIALSPSFEQFVYCARAMLPRLTRALERLDARQLDPFEVLQRRATAGRDVAEPRGPWMVGDRRGGTAAADHAKNIRHIGER